MNTVNFDNLNSYTDLSLVLTGKEVPLPSPKTYMIDVPCGDGQLDLSTALTDGTVKYNNREIKLNFTLMCSRSQVESKKSMIANAIHGKVMKVTLSEDSDFYLIGRVTVDEFITNSFPATMTVVLNAEPYKYKQDETIITVTATSTGTSNTIPDQMMKVVPVITVSADMTLIYKTKEYSLFTGENRIVDVVLSSGDSNILKFKGSGTATIKFRGGEL